MKYMRVMEKDMSDEWLTECCNVEYIPSIVEYRHGGYHYTKCSKCFLIGRIVKKENGKIVATASRIKLHPDGKGDDKIKCTMKN